MHVKRPQILRLSSSLMLLIDLNKIRKEHDIVIRRKQNDVLLHIQNYLNCVNDDYDSD